MLISKCVILNGEYAPEQHRLRFVIDTRFFKIFQSCICVVSPEIFKFVDLIVRDLTRSKLFCLARRLDEPREERPIINKG